MTDNLLDGFLRNRDAEIDRLRVALNRIQDGLRSSDNAQNADTVGRAREIALAALNGTQTGHIT